VDPVVVELHYQNGIKFFKRGLYDKAIREFEKTLSLDPDNAEARAYLEKVKDVRDNKEAVDVKISKDAEVRKLYDEGKALYRRRDYEGASAVFKKILEIKPVDDYASFYKERCEIFIARDLAKQRKSEERERSKKEKAKQKAVKIDGREMKKLERQAILKKRKEISRDRRQAQKEMQKEEAIVVKEEAAVVKDMPVSVKEKQKAKEEKIAARNERRQEKIDLKEKKIADKKEAIAKKKEAKENLKKDKADRKKKHKVDITMSDEELKNIRELYLEGVSQYARRQYQDAIASFEAVIEAESQARNKYSNSARRLMEKAKKKAAR